MRRSRTLQVENLVMDQMTSVCGEEGKLLALLCQPAVITGHVTIPPTLQFWYALMMGCRGGARANEGSS
jgi:galactokinase